MSTEDRLSRVEAELAQVQRLVRFLLKERSEPTKTQKRSAPTEGIPAKRVSPNRLIISTDGSCTNNGTDRARAGFAAVANDGRNISGAVQGKQTNQRAELSGVIAALEISRMSSDVLIRSDSAYCVKGCNEWLPNWKRRNWRKAKGGLVLNVDLWKKIDALLAERTQRSLRTEIAWVKGHAGDAGNEAADRLARQAAI